MTGTRSGLLVWSDSLESIRGLSRRALRRDRAAPMVGSLFREHVWADAVVSALRRRDLEPGLREVAIEMARERGEPPPRALNSMSWRIVREPGASADSYARALEMARGATGAEPDNPNFANTLGVALFRAEQYDEALLVLRRADELNLESRRPGNRVADLAFLAMCHQALHAPDEARLVLAQVRALCVDEEDPEVLGFLEEAVELIEGR